MNSTSDELFVADPVCATQFRQDRAAATFVHKGRTHFFCTEACRRQFELEPDRYVGKSE